MKATGIVRRIDDLGRVVIPKEIRRTLRIREGDPLEIFIEENNAVVFQKYQPLAINNDIVDIAFAMLKASSLDKFAIYDSDFILQSWPKAKEKFPVVPEDWEGKRYPFIYQENIIYPIIADGEVFGYLLGEGKDAEAILKIIAVYISKQLVIS